MKVKIAIALFVLSAAVFGVIIAQKVDKRLDVLAAVQEDGERRAAEASRVVPPVLVNPEPHPGGRRIVLTGTLVPEAAVDLGFKMPGRVIAVNVKRGDHVKAGQVLAELDDKELDAQAAQARAAIKLAQAQKSLAAESVSWSQRLKEAGVATEQQVSLATSQEGVSGAGIAQAKASVLSIAAVRSELKLTAPIDGVVVSAPTTAGFVAAPGVPLFRIERLDQVRFTGHLSERDAALVAVGTPVHVRTEAGVEATGEVSLMLGSLDRATRRMPIEAVLDNAEGRLFGGAFVDATITVETPPVLRVPLTALLTGEAPSVLLAEEGRLKRRPIVVDSTLDGWIHVRAGLSPTDQIVADPGATWRPGDSLPPVVASAE
ncbi:MAG: hypothetical protein AMXMBFR64_38380 [Myxococcales bacterium]